MLSQCRFDEMVGILFFIDYGVAEIILVDVFLSTFQLNMQVLTNCLRYYLRRPETDIDSY